MDNFQDRYIRQDPRRNAKMSPILWDDNNKVYLGASESRKDGQAAGY